MRLMGRCQNSSSGSLSSFKLSPNETCWATNAKSIYKRMVRWSKHPPQSRAELSSKGRGTSRARNTRWPPVATLPLVKGGGDCQSWWQEWLQVPAGQRMRSEECVEGEVRTPNPMVSPNWFSARGPRSKALTEVILRLACLGQAWV